jgi:hypothetical protein
MDDSPCEAYATRAGAEAAAIRLAEEWTKKWMKRGPITAHVKNDTTTAYGCDGSSLTAVGFMEVQP